MRDVSVLFASPEVFDGFVLAFSTWTLFSALVVFVGFLYCVLFKVVYPWLKRKAANNSWMKGGEK